MQGRYIIMYNTPQKLSHWYNNSLQCLAQYDEEKKQKIDKWKEEFVDYSTLKQMERLHEEMIKKIIKEKFRDYLLFLLQVDTSKTVPITHNSWDTKEKYKIYGLLISACKVKTIEPIGIEEVDYV